MKNRLKFIFAMLLLLGAGMLRAEDRIGVVDLEKVFREYHKSRAVEEFINQRAGAARNYLKQMQQQLAQLRTEMHKLGTNAGNPALSASELAEAKRLADDAIRKVKAKEAEMEMYTSRISREIRDLETKKRAEIIADINAEVRRRAGARGFNFVIDSSGKTLNQMPALIVSPADRDMTAEVIRELNRTAVVKKSKEVK